LPDILSPSEAKQASDGLSAYQSPSPLLLVISGPSGVGKDSVIQVLAERGHPFEFVVTATDRIIRTGEVDGVDYQFCTPAEFQRMIDHDELYEWAPVYDHRKGVPKANAQRAMASGKDAIMRLDVQGAATVKRKEPAAVLVFIAPPSLDALIGRLERRKTDTPEQLAQRVREAVSEIRRIPAFDYVIVNRENQLDAAVDDLLAILRAERLRAVPRKIGA